MVNFKSFLLEEFGWCNLSCGLLLKLRFALQAVTNDISLLSDDLCLFQAVRLTKEFFTKNLLMCVFFTSFYTYIGNIYKVFC